MKSWAAITKGASTTKQPPAEPQPKPKDNAPSPVAASSSTTTAAATASNKAKTIMTKPSSTQATANTPAPSVATSAIANAPVTQTTPPVPLTYASTVTAQSNSANQTHNAQAASQSANASSAPAQSQAQVPASVPQPPPTATTTSPVAANNDDIEDDDDDDPMNLLPSQLDAVMPNSNASGGVTAAMSGMKLLDEDETIPENPLSAPKIVFRAHHVLPRKCGMIIMSQLASAQGICQYAQNYRISPQTYQENFFASHNIDPRVLYHPPSPKAFLQYVTANQNPEMLQMGQMLYTDPGVYSYIELFQRYPHLATINNSHPTSHNAYFAKIQATEQEIHYGIKYSRWGTTNPQTAMRLNEHFAKLLGVANVFLFFLSSDSYNIAGVSVLESQFVNPNAGAEQSDQEQRPSLFQARLRWIYIKDVPLKFLPPGLISLVPEEQSEIAEINYTTGADLLNVVHHNVPSSSILLDFKYFDEAERAGVGVESGKKQLSAQRNQNRQPYQRHNNYQSNAGGRGGKRTFQRPQRGGFGNKPRTPTNDREPRARNYQRGYNSQTQDNQNEIVDQTARDTGNDQGVSIATGEAAGPTLSEASKMTSESSGGNNAFAQRKSRQNAFQPKTNATNSKPPAERVVLDADGEKVKLASANSIPISQKSKQSKNKKKTQEKETEKSAEEAAETS